MAFSLFSNMWATCRQHRHWTGWHRHQVHRYFFLISVCKFYPAQSATRFQKVDISTIPETISLPFGPIHSNSPPGMLVTNQVNSTVLLSSLRICLYSQAHTCHPHCHSSAANKCQMYKIHVIQFQEMDMSMHLNPIRCVHSSEKCLLASSCPSASISGTFTGQISMTFDIAAFYEN